MFKKMHERRNLIDYEVAVSIVEIYNEQILDLLGRKGQVVKLRDNGEGDTISD